MENSENLSSEANPNVVSLCGKLHQAHPSLTTFVLSSSSHGGKSARVPQPLCGQRSSRFSPCHALKGFAVNCEKCLAKLAEG